MVELSMEGKNNNKKEMILVTERIEKEEEKKKDEKEHSVEIFSKRGNPEKIKCSVTANLEFSGDTSDAEGEGKKEKKEVMQSTEHTEEEEEKKNESENEEDSGENSDGINLKNMSSFGNKFKISDPAFEVPVIVAEDEEEEEKKKEEEAEHDSFSEVSQGDSFSEVIEEEEEKVDSVKESDAESGKDSKFVEEDEEEEDDYEDDDSSEGNGDKKLRSFAGDDKVSKSNRRVYNARQEVWRLNDIMSNSGLPLIEKKKAKERRKKVKQEFIKIRDNRDLRKPLYRSSSSSDHSVVSEDCEGDTVHSNDFCSDFDVFSCEDSVA